MCNQVHPAEKMWADGHRFTQVVGGINQVAGAGQSIMQSVGGGLVQDFPLQNFVADGNIERVSGAGGTTCSEPSTWLCRDV